MALSNPPYIAPYANIFTDPVTGEDLFVEVWNGGGWDRVETVPSDMKVTYGNPDRGYEDVRDLRRGS